MCTIYFIQNTGKFNSRAVKQADVMLTNVYMQEAPHRCDSMSAPSGNIAIA
jgi:hypothetical protein